MNIKIEKKVPLPSRGRNNYRLVYEQMEPGDSFKIQKNQYQAALMAARRLGLKITTRKIDEGSLRVWLVSGAKP